MQLKEFVQEKKATIVIEFYPSFTPILPRLKFRHKKTNLKWLVFLGNFGRHDRI